MNNLKKTMKKLISNMKEGIGNASAPMNIETKHCKCNEKHETLTQKGSGTTKKL